MFRMERGKSLRVENQDLVIVRKDTHAADCRSRRDRSEGGTSAGPRTGESP